MIVLNIKVADFPVLEISGLTEVYKRLRRRVLLPSLGQDLKLEVETDSELLQIPIRACRITANSTPSSFVILYSSFLKFSLMAYENHV